VALPAHSAEPGAPCAARWTSGRLFVAGYFGYVELGGLAGCVDPSGVAVA